MMPLLLALHALALALAALGVVPAGGPPIFYAFLLPFSLTHAAGRFGARRAALLFGATFAVTLAAELFGTNVGLFGARYAYAPAAWAPLPGGFILAAVPCMWFMMMYPSYVVARLMVGRRAHAAIAVVGALVMTAWDVVLDPTAVAAGLWRWSGGTPSLLDIPLENYLAWFVGSVPTIALYSVVDRDDEPTLHPVAAYGAVALYYAATSAPGVGLAALAAMGAPAALAVARALARRAPRPAVLRLAPEWAGPPAPGDVGRLRRADFLRHPVKNHFVNSLHVVVAHGERYMIANIRRVRARLRSPELGRQADWFVAQEASHAAEHRRFSAQLARLGYDVGRLDRLCRFAGQRLLPRVLGARLNMAVTVAIEHWTACVAEIVLRDRLLADLDPAARRLVEWHCFEELEHRAVAFDVWRDVCGSYLVRLAGMAIGVQLIALLSLYGLVSFLAQDRQLLSWRAWREGLRFFYLREALVVRTLPRALALARPGFHPTAGFCGVDRGA